jgi:hypothetical protein
MTVRTHLEKMHGRMTEHHESLAARHTALAGHHASMTKADKAFSDHHVAMKGEHEEIAKEHAAMATYHGECAAQCAKAADSIDLNRLVPTAVSALAPTAPLRAVPRPGQPALDKNVSVPLEFEHLVKDGS